MKSFWDWWMNAQCSWRNVMGVRTRSTTVTLLVVSIQEQRMQWTICAGWHPNMHVQLSLIITSVTRFLTTEVLWSWSLVSRQWRHPTSHSDPGTLFSKPNHRYWLTWLVLVGHQSKTWLREIRWDNFKWVRDKCIDKIAIINIFLPEPKLFMVLDTHPVTKWLIYFISSNTPSWVFRSSKSSQSQHLQTYRQSWPRHTTICSSFCSSGTPEWEKHVSSSDSQKMHSMQPLYQQLVSEPLLTPTLQT